jgi:hypothetical protein
VERRGKVAEEDDGIHIIILVPVRGKVGPIAVAAETAAAVAVAESAAVAM